MDERTESDPILIEMIAFEATQSMPGPGGQETAGSATLVIASRMGDRPRMAQWIEGLRKAEGEAADMRDNYRRFLEEHGRFAAARDESKDWLGEAGAIVLRKLEEQGFERIESGLQEDPYQIGMAFQTLDRGEIQGFFAECQIGAERLDRESLARIRISIMAAAEEAGLSAAVSLAARGVPGVPDRSDHDEMVAEAIARLRAKEDRERLEASSESPRRAKARRIA